MAQSCCDDKKPDVDGDQPKHNSYPDPLLEDNLRRTARSLVEPGKGIIALDESSKTVLEKFSVFKINYRGKEMEMKDKYRELYFTTPEEANKYVSGIILHEDAVSLRDIKGQRYVDLLKKRNILVGVRLDTGLVNLFCAPYEGTTQGLDNLGRRCERFKELGCAFSKWRCVFKITPSTPTYHALVENANVLARFAGISQSKGLVPIIEAEVLQDGSYDLARCEKVTQSVLSFVFMALHTHNILLEGMILMPNMVVAGEANPNRPTPKEVAEATLSVLTRTVPPAVPGIAFCSGGLSEEEATKNLQEIAVNTKRKPWTCTFGFGRALQASALTTWKGDKNNVCKAQVELVRRLRANSLASLGMYGGFEDFKGPAVDYKLFIRDYTL